MLPKATTSLGPVAGGAGTDGSSSEPNNPSNAGFRPARSKRGIVSAFAKENNTFLPSRPLSMISEVYSLPASTTVSVELSVSFTGASFSFSIRSLRFSSARSPIKTSLKTSKAWCPSESSLLEPSLGLAASSAAGSLACFSSIFAWVLVICPSRIRQRGRRKIPRKLGEGQIFAPSLQRLAQRPTRLLNSAL